MKKALILVLVLGLLLAVMPAGADGKLSVEQENFHVIDAFAVYGFVYAKVANVGDQAIKVSNALMEVMDKDGNAITSTDYFNGHARYLEPGEYTYLRLNEAIEDRPAADVDGCTLTVTGISDGDYKNLRLPVVCEYKENVQVDWNTRNIMYATVTNNTEDIIYDLGVVLALLDAQGNILYMDSSYMGSDKGLLPGSSIIVREYVDNLFITVFESKGLVPASVDAIAYAEVRR
ncbi:MAG: hypothetical protein GXZ04_07490 [Clostridiales bacterium]|nr:hypothetical protein [Clostridiales bacterium]